MVYGISILLEAFKLFELVSGALVQLFLFTLDPYLFGGGPEIREPCQQLLTLLTLKSTIGCHIHSQSRT